MVFIKSFKNQTWLFPPAIEDLIPEDHVCFLVENFIESLDFSAFEEKYEGAGHPAYHPGILLKLLVMGVIDKIRSSRRLAKNARENVVYMYLAEKLAPDFRTISDFRKDNPDLIKTVFKHTVHLARKEGMLNLSHLSTDGTKIKANAADKRILTKEELEFVMKFVENELETWAAQDSLEDDFFDNIRGSDLLPGSSRKRVKSAVKHYIEELKEKGELYRTSIEAKLERAHQEVENNDLEKVSMTDPESRFMKSKKGRIELSYNFQITADQNGFILANDVTDSSADTHQLKPMVIQTEQNLEKIQEKIKWSFDNGYNEGENLKFLIDKKIDGYIPGQTKSTENRYDKSNFIYDKEKDVYVCPEGKSLIFFAENFDIVKNKLIKKYRSGDCENCLKQKECTRTKDGRRIVNRDPYEEERNAMDKKMQLPESKEIYKLRKEIVEPVFGDIKENKGITRFLTRGLKMVKTEMNLISIANNICRFHLRKNKRASIGFALGV
jgi:transposase